MKRFHQLFGIAVVIIFLLTGKYMDVYLHHLRDMPDGLRMLYRTRHIYILLAGLLNVGIGSYFTYRNERWRRVLQLMGSALIVVATALLFAAFWLDTQLQHLATPWTHKGMYAILAGALFHWFSGLGEAADVRNQPRINADKPPGDCEVSTATP
jgi:hypothetical protein